MDDSLLTVTVVTTEPEITLELVGEVDLSSVPIIDAALGGIDEGTGRVTLDLAGVTFLDSSGLACIGRARSALAAAGRELVLRSPTPPVRRVLDITGMDHLIAGVSDLDEPDAVRR